MKGTDPVGSHTVVGEEKVVVVGRLTYISRANTTRAVGLSEGNVKYKEKEEDAAKTRGDRAPLEALRVRFGAELARLCGAWES